MPSRVHSQGASTDKGFFFGGGQVNLHMLIMSSCTHADWFSPASECELHVEYVSLQ